MWGLRTTGSRPWLTAHVSHYPQARAAHERDGTLGAANPGLPASGQLSGVDCHRGQLTPAVGRRNPLESHAWSVARGLQYPSACRRDPDARRTSATPDATPTWHAACAPLTPTATSYWSDRAPGSQSSTSTHSSVQRLATTRVSTLGGQFATPRPSPESGGSHLAMRATQCVKP